MAISERVLNRESSEETAYIQWFIVRQPGIVRFLGERLQDEALGLALLGASRIARAFQTQGGVPCGHIDSAALERSEEEVLRRALGDVQKGLPERQPALVAHIAALMDAPPVMLSHDQRRDVGVALLTVSHALETGRGACLPR